MNPWMTPSVWRRTPFYRVRIQDLTALAYMMKVRVTTIRHVELLLVDLICLSDSTLFLVLILFW